MLISVFNALRKTDSPNLFKEMFHYKNYVRYVRNDQFLEYQYSPKSRFGYNAFSYAGAALWNSNILQINRLMTESISFQDAIHQLLLNDLLIG